MTDRHLTLEHAWLEDGWSENVRLAIGPDGLIQSVEADAAPGSGRRVRGAALPGMPNLHSHGFQHLIAGLTGMRADGADSFWGWRESMYRAAATVDPQTYEDVLAFAFLSMLRAGFTACAEFHYLHHQPDGRPYAALSEMGQRAVAAARRVGMPLTLLPVLYCRSGFDGAGVERRQRRFRSSPDQYLRLLDDLAPVLAGTPHGRLGVAPHSLRAVSPSALRDTLGALPSSLPRHIHVAEQPAEVEACLEHHGARPVSLLLDSCAVDDRWCLVHATHMDHGERQRAAATGAVAGLCPVTEADLGDGLFEAEAWQSLGGAWGIGTDSNVRIGVADELRQLEYGERLRTGRRNVLARSGHSTGESLYREAALGGARAIGQRTGRIAPGCRADFVLLDTAHFALADRPRAAWLDCYVFAHQPDMLLATWVAGEPVFEREGHPEWRRLEGAYLAAVRRVAEA